MNNRKTLQIGVIALLLLFFTCGALMAQNARADSLRQAGNYAAALKIFNDNLDEDIKAEDLVKQSKDYNNIADVYDDMGDYDKSTEYYFKSLKIAEKNADLSTQAMITYNIADNYFNAGKRDYCVEFLNKAIKLAGHGIKNDSVLANCYTMLGGISGFQQKYDEALVYLDKAEALFTALKQNDFIANVYTEIANVGLEKPDYKLAEEYSRKSLALYKKENDPAGVATAYINLEMAYFINLKDTNVIEKKDLISMIVLLDSASLAIKSLKGHPDVEIKIYENKTELYKRIKQYDSAFLYQKKFYSLSDSVHAVEKNRQLDELKVQYEAGKKEEENILLQKKTEKQQYLIIILVISLAALVTCALLIFRIFRMRAKHKAMLMEQQLLRAQMNPHFLFNAINSIQHYILSGETQYAYDYLAKFSKLVRQVLTNSERDNISLKKELEFLETYIDLEQRRFKNRFEYKLNYDADAPLSEIEIPVMLIQPFVENAIWHGIMNLDENAKGKLTIDFDLKNSDLKIIVEDNGIGREKAAKLKTRGEHESVGMMFSQKRLELLKSINDMDASIIVTDLHDDKGQATGTRVEINLPNKN